MIYFKKAVIIPFLSDAAILKSHYYTHLNQKSFIRCVVLILVPVIGNIIIALFDHYSKEYQRMLSLVQKDGMALKDLPIDFQLDKEIVLAAVRQNGMALNLVDERFLHDKEIVLAAVSKMDWPYSLQVSTFSMIKKSLLPLLIKMEWL